MKYASRWAALPTILLLATCTPQTPSEKSENTAFRATAVSQSIETDTVPLATPEKAADTVSAFDISYLTGKFDPTKHIDFVQIELKYASEAGMYLRKDTYDAFKKMANAAAKAGVSLKIISATRPFSHQKRIWEQKWNGQRLVNGADLSKTTPDATKRAKIILEYSSMPGTSRHHWGTDFDLNNLTNAHFETGSGKKMYEWMYANAAEYGFCQPYSPHGPERPTGYNEEKWHWSYMPVSSKLTKLAEVALKNENIAGFDGANTAITIDIVKNYVLGVNKACL